jgi:diaminopimelate decarboxylase/aspartate kinase
MGETFFGLCTGMNSLLRPAMYGSHHALCNISRREDHGPRARVNVCGPICESADMIARYRSLSFFFFSHHLALSFARGRLLPASTAEGDVMLIDCVGAYGKAMLVEYNLRAAGEELVFGATHQA